MGRLVGLELHNFKSYKGTCTIGFGTSCFTSIIGPNGSGKSNMMDAISFVLGVQSSQLRSQHMKDLIYRGTLGVNGTENSADPQKAYVKVIYEADNGERVELKRSITINGSTEYRLNNKAVTSLQYASFLKQQNILIKARNFLVFQGDVEQIASQNAKDLTKLIETVSGSIEFAKEFDQLKEEMDNAHEFTNSVFSRKRTLNSESKHYKEQMMEQEIFTRKLLDKANLIKIINLYKLYHNEKNHRELKDSIISQKTQLKELKQNLVNNKKNLDDLIKAYSQGNLELKIKQEEMIGIGKNVESSKRNLLPINASQKALVNKITITKQKIKDLTSEIAVQESVVDTTESKLKEINKLYKQFQNKTIKTKLPNEAHDEYDKLRGIYLSNGGADLQEQLSLLMQEKETLEVEIDNYQSQVRNYKSTLKQMEINELRNKQVAVNLEINDLLGAKQDHVNHKHEILKNLEEFNEKEMTLNRELRQVLLKLDELQSKQRESNKQRKLRDNLIMLKNVMPQGTIKGFVHELIRPNQAKYQQALTTILGRNMNAIIVETSAVAYKCIDILKEKRLGVATFIPMDSIVSEAVNLNYLRSLHPQAQPGVDVVEYDDHSLEQTVQYVVGDCLVTEDLLVARSLKWNNNLTNKIVTVDGSMINRSGLMTGGVNKEVNSNWDKNELKRFGEIKDDLLIELAKINENKPKDVEIKVIDEALMEIDDKLPLLRSQKETILRVINDKQREMEFTQRQINEINNLIQEKRDKIGEIDNDIEEINQKTEAINEDIFKQFCKTYKISVQQYEEMYGVSIRAKNKEQNQYVKMISRLTNEKNLEMSMLTDLASRRDGLVKDLSDLEFQYNEILDDKEKLELDLDRVVAEQEVFREDVMKFEDTVNAMLKQTKQLEVAIGEINNDIAAQTMTMTNVEEALLKVDIERISILKNCKIDSVIVPLKDGLLEQVSLDESMDELVKVIYDVEIDYELLNDNLMENFSSRVEAELHAKLDTITKELEQLTPNSKAAQRLQEAETRLRDFDRDFTSARQKENKIIARYTNVKNQRHELFIKAFDHISSKIDGIYKELTRTSSSPLGGSAYLTLEDENDPYLSGIKYHAMPPMKRFRDMDLLSGGEKTIAALALLFAIHSYQPSPFFVLDEVDAALDSVNVTRIANYIKNASSPSFQFIVISLKNTLFEKSDALVGIYREQSENSSKTLSLDLREYPPELAPELST